MWHRRESLPQMSQIHTDGTEANRLSEGIFSYAFMERAIVGRQVVSKYGFIPAGRFDDRSRPQALIKSDATSHAARSSQSRALALGASSQTMTRPACVPHTDAGTNFLGTRVTPIVLVPFGSEQLAHRCFPPTIARR
jgi:hypothetical protein